MVHRVPLDVFTVFNSPNVVYLSPDADEPLEEVVVTDVYVIGGIVDRNLHKGLSKAAAEGGNARAVRLPFDEHFPEVSCRYRVLTVCACVGVLVAVHSGEDWRSALEKNVPRRGLTSTLQRPRGGAWRGAAPSDGPGWGAGKTVLSIKGTSSSRGSDGVLPSASAIGHEVV